MSEFREKFAEKFTPKNILGLIEDIFRFLPRFIMNPVETLNDLPNWDWPVVIGLQILMGLITGALAGLVVLEPLHVIGNALLFPIQYILCSFLTYGVIHLVVQPYLQIQMTRKETYILSTLLLLPMMLFRILSLTGIPTEILGVALGLWLFYETLQKRYNAPKESVQKLTMGLTIAVAATWIASRFLH